MTAKTWMLTLATLLVALAAPGSAAAASRDPIPAILVDPVDPAATPEPICGVCAIVTGKAEDDSVAKVSVTSREDFQGAVEVVFWLDSEQTVSVWIPYVEIQAGDRVSIPIAHDYLLKFARIDFAWTKMYAF